MNADGSRRGGPLVSFVTDRGQVVPAVTTAQMRKIDRIATRSTGPTLLQMMENAGRNLADQAIESLGEDWRQGEILVLAGSGGNGGGGIGAARHLANRGGRVALTFADSKHLGEAGKFQFSIYRNSGGRVLPPSALAGYAPDLILDALIGYGLSRPPGDLMAELILWANGARAPTISLDVPSGLDADRGTVASVAVKPDLTLTLALPKVGLVPAATGRPVLADLGIPMLTYRRAGIRVRPLFDHRARIPLLAHERVGPDQPAVESFPVGSGPPGELEPAGAVHRRP